MKTIPCDCPYDTSLIDCENDIRFDKDGTPTLVDHTNCERKRAKMDMMARFNRIKNTVTSPITYNKRVHGHSH